jgi:hypothetical protein
MNRLRQWWRRRQLQRRPPFDWNLDAPEFGIPNEAHVRIVAEWPPRKPRGRRP